MRRIAFAGLVLAVLGMLFLFSPKLSQAGGLPAATNVTLAPTKATFVIPPAEGYGVGDCLHGSEECGRAVADGWCIANGFERASTFGPVRNNRNAAVSLLLNGSARPSFSVHCER